MSEITRITIVKVGDEWCVERPGPGEGYDSAIVGRALMRAAHETHAQIEITPQMVAAGEDILLCELGGAVSSHWFPDELAKAVYRAMNLALTT